MAVEAPYSKYRRTNFIIYGIVLLAFSGWCIYDGYYNEKWIQEHTAPDGSPEAYLTFNRKAPYVLTPVGVVLVGFYFVVRNKKMVAGENELVISAGEKIPYEAVQKIDKTHYDSKGYFTITYKNEAGTEQTKKLSYKKYDNLKEVLEHLVAKIS